MPAAVWLYNQVSYDNCLRAYDTVTAVLKYEWENESRCHFTGLEVDVEFGEVRGPGWWWWKGWTQGEWLMESGRQRGFTGSESRCHFTGLEVNVEFGEVRGEGGP